jgi:hypothetical protein
MVKKNENSFKFKGNGIPFDLNSDLIDNLEWAQHYLELKKISIAFVLIDDSLKALSKRNKLIRIAINPTEVGILYQNTFRTR